MELGIPIEDERDFVKLLKGIRSNTTVSECSISTDCFHSLSAGQRRELVFAICELPSLRSLILDSVFPEFLYTYNSCRCWKRDQYYRQYRRYCELENRTLKITDIPADIDNGLLIHLVTSTVSNFASLIHLNMTFAGDLITSPQAVLTRAALTALNHSSSLKDVKLGYDDDFGEYNFVMEIDASRNENILRVLKLRCDDGNSLSEESYMELAQMINVNSRTLKGLVLDTAVDNNGALTIANTLGCSSLKALCLGTFACQDKTKRFGLLSLLSQVLCPPQYLSERGSTRSTLEYLSLVCQGMDDEGIEQISTAFSRSQLKELMLFLDNEMDSTVSSQGIAALAQVFQLNDTIEEFSLICHSLDDSDVVAFAEALKVNSGSLKTLKLQCSKAIRITSKGYQVIIDMLKTNTALEAFELRRSPGSEEDDDFIECDSSKTAILEHMPEIDFYLSINKSGIRSLQLDTNTTLKEFRSSLVSHHNDLSKVFYMLSANPSFVSLGA